MSWDWPDASFNRTFDAGVGAAPAGGVDLTVTVVAKCRGLGFGAIGATSAGSLAWSVFADGGKWFFGTDFVGGPAASTTEWTQVCARYNASAGQVMWRYRQTTGGGASWGSWGNLTAYSVSESGHTTIDALVTGIVNDRSSGLIAAVGVWSGQLADATVDALGVSIPDWRSSTDVALVWQFNAISSPPVGADLVDITGGGADGTSYNTNAGGTEVILGADPPDIVYYAPGTSTPVSGTIAAVSTGSLAVTADRPASGAVAASSTGALAVTARRAASGTIAAHSAASLSLVGSAAVYVKRGGSPVLVTGLAGAVKRGGVVVPFG